MNVGRTCTTDGCDRPAYCRGLCSRCYQQAWRASKPEGHWRTYRATCEAEACDRVAVAGGLCRLHRSVADGVAVHTAAVPPTTECTYEQAHARVRQWRGKATEHRCLVCGEQAEVWAHMHRSTAPVLHQRRRKYGKGRWYVMPYSPLVWDYQPMCRVHHARADSRQGHGSLLPAVCTSPVCDRPAHALGWCKSHHRRWLVTGDARPDEPIRPKRPSTTTGEG